MAHRGVALWALLAVLACAWCRAAAECCDASDEDRASPFCLMYDMLTDEERADVRADLGENCDGERAKQEKAAVSEEDVMSMAQDKREDEDPKFLRFGRDGSDPKFLRFGKRKPNFLRFGKRKPNFLRFGKRKPNFLRFGKRSAPLVEAEEFDREMRKPNFLRFGKRKPNFLRFGKRKPNFLRFGKRKPNFLRFGKRSDDAEAEKRKPNFLRFGKKSV